MNRSELIFLGDSLTMRHNWSAFKAANMGIDGDTTEGILSRLHHTKGAKKIVLMIGVNDILNQIPSKQIQKNYLKILHSFSPQQEIIILSLLPVVNMKGTQLINQEIRTINRWLKLQTKNLDFSFINFYPDFLDDTKKGLKKSFTTDGIHLTASAYRLWEKLLKNTLK